MERKQGACVDRPLDLVITDGMQSGEQLLIWEETDDELRALRTCCRTCHIRYALTQLPELCMLPARENRGCVDCNGKHNR